MNQKDRLLNPREIMVIDQQYNEAMESVLSDGDEAEAEITMRCGINAYLLAQDRKTFKKVLEWGDEHIPKTLANYVGFWQVWQGKLKEWSLD